MKPSGIELLRDKIVKRHCQNEQFQQDKSVGVGSGGCRSAPPIKKAEQIQWIAPSPTDARRLRHKVAVTLSERQPGGLNLGLDPSVFPETGKQSDGLNLGLIPVFSGVDEQHKVVSTFSLYYINSL